MFKEEDMYEAKIMLRTYRDALNCLEKAAYRSALNK